MASAGRPAVVLAALQEKRLCGGAQPEWLCFLSAAAVTAAGCKLQHNALERPLPGHSCYSVQPVGR